MAKKTTDERKVNTHIRTLVLETYVHSYTLNKEEAPKNNAYDRLRQLSFDARNIANGAIRVLFLNNSLRDYVGGLTTYTDKYSDIEKLDPPKKPFRKNDKVLSEEEKALLMKKYDEEKLLFDLQKKALKDSLTNEVIERFETVFETDNTEGKSVYQIMCSKYPTLSTDLIGGIINKASSAFMDSCKEVLQGKKRILFYREGFPIPFRNTATKIISIPGEEGKEDRIGIELNTSYQFEGKRTSEKIVLAFRFGRDRGNYSYTMKRVLSGELAYAEVSLNQKDGGKWFMSFPVYDEIQKVKLDLSIAVGVDLGINTPAYVALSSNEKVRKAIGTKEEFLRVRTRLQAIKRNIQANLVNTTGGHGRKKKLSALEKIQDREGNFVKTYNHQLTSQIVSFAVNNGAGVIKMEELKGFSKNDKSNWILRNWSYFQVQTMIEYKAKRYGIKVVKIDPYHTSQTCSKCGNYEPEQRKGEWFTCKKCEEKMNADYNAAVNIARSEKEIKDGEKTEYERRKEEGSE